MSESETQVENTERRDFLYVATGAAGAVIGGLTVWPLIDQMNPSADVLALASIRVDISGVAEGTQIRELWQGKPVFIRHRTQAEIDEARAVPMDDLKDPQ
ncbi:MAG: ubiquinol-cytochrome c reductase iron-sulfur subunit, partial [Pseudomonadota bacterium]